MSSDTTILTDYMTHAVAFCAEKTGLQGWDRVAAARAEADCLACEYLRYGLAKGVADYLGSLDETIRRVYVFEPEAVTQPEGHLPARPRLSPGISMLIWVSRKTAALNSLLASVRQAAQEEFWRLPCPEANALCSDLDTIVVDDQEVTRRIGYGALVESVFVQPTEIWRRQAEPQRQDRGPGLSI